MLDAKLIPKIQKLLPLLSSDQDGEVIAAVRAVTRALKAGGADIHDLTKAIGGGGGSSRFQSYAYSNADSVRERGLRESAERRANSAEKRALVAEAQIETLRHKIRQLSSGEHAGKREWVDAATPAEAAAQCVAYAELLSDWEKNFCADMAQKYGELSEKQTAALKRCWLKVKAFALAKGDIRDV